MVAQQQLPASVSADYSPVFTPETVEYFIPSRLDIQTGVYRVPCSLPILKLNCVVCAREPERTRQLHAALAKVDAQYAGQWVRLSSAEVTLLYLQNKIGFAELVTYQLGSCAELSRVRSYFETLLARPTLETGVISLTFALSETLLLQQVTHHLLDCLLLETFDYLRLDVVAFPERQHIALQVDLPRQYHLEALRMYTRTVVEYLSAE